MQDQVDALRALGVRAGFINSTQDFDERRAGRGRVPRRRAGPALPGARSGCGWSSTLRPARRAARSRSSRSTRRTASPSGATTSGPTTWPCRCSRERWPDVPRIALTATATRRHAPGDHPAAAACRTPGTSWRASTGPTSSTGSCRRPTRRSSCWRFLREEHAGDAGIVYCLSRNSVEKTAEFLCRNGIEAVPYHAGLDARTRAAHQSRFLREDGLVVVRHDRLRHGHRQAGRPVRRPPRPAEVGRGLLPGDGPRRAATGCRPRPGWRTASRTSSSSAR